MNRGALLAVAFLAWFCDAGPAHESPHTPDADTDMAADARPTPDAPSDAAPDAAPDAGHHRPTVEYRLDWDLSGVAFDDTGRAHLATPEGLRLTLTELVLVTRAVQLVPCDPHVPDAGQGAWRIGPRRAWAGHDDVPNPAAFDEPVVERPLDAPARTPGQRPLEAGPYCRVHWLVGRMPADASELPGVSLLVRGESAHGDGPATPFAVESALGHGLLLALDEAALDAIAATASEGPVTVTVTRPLARLFDGFDPAALSEPEAERFLLQRLVDSAQIAVR